MVRMLETSSDCSRRRMETSNEATDVQTEGVDDDLQKLSESNIAAGST